MVDFFYSRLFCPFPTLKCIYTIALKGTIPDVVPVILTWICVHFITVSVYIYNTYNH